ncbi:MAG: hypothetical protein GMKNLPBB_02142 [Myxococcota bacterium]|nr:hypothetical protein [Myxococcota bacterium]
MAKTVLLAEASKTYHTIVPWLLKDSDCTIVDVYSAGEVLSRARESRPDLILLQNNIGEPDGYALCKEIRSDGALRGVPVLMLAGVNNKYDEARGADAGVDAWVTKPFDSKDFLEKVSALLEKGSSVAAAPDIAPFAPPPMPAPTQGPAIPEPRFGGGPAPTMAAPSEPKFGGPAAPAPTMAASSGPAPTQAAFKATPVSQPAIKAPAAPAPAKAPPAGLDMPFEPDEGVDVAVDIPAAAPVFAPPAAPAGPAKTQPPPKPAVTDYTPPPANGELVSRAEVEAMVRQRVEEILWEVVPELTETLLREKLNEILKRKAGV